MNVSKKSIFKMVAFAVLVFFQVTATFAAELNKIVAVVNSEIITQGDLNTRIVMMRKHLGPNASASELRKKALDSLIDVALQKQLAKRANINITDKELDSIVLNIAKDHGLTLEQLKKTLREQDGLSFGEFRNQLREQTLIGRVQQQFLGRTITVDSKEIDEMLKHPPKMDSRPAEYHVAYILLEIPDGSSQEQISSVTSLAKGVLPKLKQAKDMAAITKIAEQNYKNQVVKSDDLGWRRLDELPDIYAKEVAKMGINQAIGPITAPNGLHLIKLLGIHGLQGGKITRDQAANMVYQKKIMQKIVPWLQELREAAYLKIND